MFYKGFEHVQLTTPNGCSDGRRNGANEQNGGRHDGRRSYKTGQGDEQHLKLFFLDHVPENDKKQDRVTVSFIMEAICFRIRKELPGAEEKAFFSDNARN